VSDVVRQESMAIAELAALHRDPLFYGRGVPRGDGRLVLVVPGLFGNDVYLQPLRGWLSRIGYRPVASSLAVNAGCPDRLRSQVEKSLQRRLDKHPGPISLIGHSRGGMLCWAIASRLQGRAAQLILMGSPAPAVVAMMRQYSSIPRSVANSMVADAGARALKIMDPDCTVPACGCAYTEDLRRSLHPDTKVLAIFSRTDYIVRPEACSVPDGIGAGSIENVEITGSHSGLAYNRHALRHVARFLGAS
jgi:pimeloyl-ACP methyl ester carboxylesterase